MNTREYVVEVQKKHGAVENIAKTSRLFGVSRQTVYGWLNGDFIFKDEHVIKAANLLELPHGEVLLNIEIERTQCPEARAVWAGLLQQITGHAAGIFLAVAMVYGMSSGALPSPAFAGESGIFSIMLSNPQTLLAGFMLLISMGFMHHARATYRKSL